MAEEKSSAFFMPLYPCFGLWICLGVDKMPKIWYHNSERMVKMPYTRQDQISFDSLLGRAHKKVLKSL